MNAQTQRQVEIRCAQLSLLSSYLFWIIPVTAFIALALAFATNDEQIARNIRVYWFAAVCVLLVLRALVLNRWMRYPATADNMNFRIHTATVLSTATACLFGIYGYMAISPDYPMVSLIIIMVFTGMVASATVGVASLRTMHVLYVFPLMGPPSLRMMEMEELSVWFVGVLVFLYFASSLLTSRAVGAFILRSIELRFENLELLDSLKHQHRQAEVALAREEKANRDKSRFLAAASHDLRQPLHSLRLFTATLELRTRNTEHKTLVNQIDSSVKSLEELFNALLDISKLDAGTVSVEKRHVFLDDLLGQIESDFKPLAKQKNLAFSVTSDGQVVHTDIPLLETMLRNLVSNAIRYTDSGSVSVTTSSAGGRVSIAVCDTGIGISESDQVKIFEEFVQLSNAERDRNQGIGLGLSIVKRLADLLDVQLRVESNTGCGATFYADVPQGDLAQCLPELSTVPETSRWFDSLFVLVVDDEEDACLAIEGLLETWGCIVMCAPSGDAAMQQLREIGDIPDLIISDYRLRDGETGGEVVGRIRKELDARLPAIILTGDIASERLQDIKALNLPSLHKPCEPESLRELIARETAADKADQHTAIAPIMALSD